jgi:hypothetical protein
MKSSSHIILRSKLIVIGFIVSILLSYNLKSIAQQDSIKNYKNTVRMNVTNPMLFGYKSLIFGYERQLRNSQSFSINLGRTYYSTFTSSEFDSLREAKGTTTNDKGFHISVDYRWYLKKQNKFAAPSGLYIGPYCSYNYFNRTNDWILTNEGLQTNVNTDLTVKIGTFGGELGYQFLLGKKQRWSIDMILFGPGIAHYQIKTNINTDLSAEDESMVFDELNNILHEKFPGMNHIIDGEGYQRSGNSNVTDLGYRYMVLVGYRF